MRLDNVARFTRWHKFVNAALIILSIILSSCGGGGGGGDDGTKANSGWVTISSSNITVGEDSMATAILSGKAFVAAETYIAHRCAGLECVFGWYDNSYPGVDITWANLTTGKQGAARSRYGTVTSWDHLWSASVPVIFGVNKLQVTAADPAGNSATAKVSVEYTPPPPSGLLADTGDGEITLSWDTIQNVTTYRLYMATTPGVTFTLGTHVEVTNPPYVHTGLANGTTYYYAITSVHQTNESQPSVEVSATAGAPPRPGNLNATLSGSDVQLTWDIVSAADFYTLYWSNQSGVTKQNGIHIFGAISPYLHTGLNGLPYYYVMTATNGNGESLESEESLAVPPIAPPAPTGLWVAQRRSGGVGYLQAVDLGWEPVLGTYDYDVYRCHAWASSTADGCEPSPPPVSCYGPWERIGRNVAGTSFVDWTVDTVAYWYYVTARNVHGNSLPSDWAGLCIEP